MTRTQDVKMFKILHIFFWHFVILVFTFGSWIHFQFILIQGEKCRCNLSWFCVFLIYPQMASQLTQSHLLNCYLYSITNSQVCLCLFWDSLSCSDRSIYSQVETKLFLLLSSLLSFLDFFLGYFKYLFLISTLESLCLVPKIVLFLYFGGEQDWVKFIG